MTPIDLQRIRSAFATIAQEPDRFATAFRARAVTLDPELARLIPAVDGVHAARIVDSIGAVLDGLDTVACSVAKERAFALSHRWGGIRPHHYASIGQALLDALGLRLGLAFDDATRAACAQAFVLIAEALMARCYNPLGLVA